MEKRETKTSEKTTCKGCYMYTICILRKEGLAPALRDCYVEVKH